MEYRQKLLIITLILIGIAVYVALTISPITSPDKTAAEKIALKGMEFGKGMNEYTYTYTEFSDEYKTKYIIVKNGNLSSVNVENPLSFKTAYFSENSSILCVKYLDNDACSEEYGNVEVQNYMDSLRAKLLSDKLIDKNRNDLSYLIVNNYITFKPTVTQKTIGSSKCQEVGYTLDLSNISLTEAARFSIGSNSPKVFDWTICVDNESGTLYEKSFTYKIGNVTHTYSYKLGYLKAGGVVKIPQNLSGDAADLLFKERKQQVRLVDCYVNKEGDDQDKCIADMAIDYRRKDLCELTGPRKDRCLVSLVPLIKDQSICNQVVDLSFKDDCYVELAGAYKNDSYCQNIQNLSKTDSCMMAAIPKNVTKSDVDINDFINKIDKN